MHRKRARRILGIWKKSVSWVLASAEDGWLSELTEALRRVPRVVGCRWKSQRRKIVYHSPYVEKPFNSKVIKSFVPELRSRKCFSCFGIPMLSIYMLWTFYVHFTYPYHGYVTISLLLFYAIRDKLNLICIILWRDEGFRTSELIFVRTRILHFHFPHISKNCDAEWKKEPLEWHWP